MNEYFNDLQKKVMEGKEENIGKSSARKTELREAGTARKSRKNILCIQTGGGRVRIRKKDEFGMKRIEPGKDLLSR